MQHDDHILAFRNYRKARDKRDRMEGLLGWLDKSGYVIAGPDEKPHPRHPALTEDLWVYLDKKRRRGMRNNIEDALAVNQLIRCLKDIGATCGIVIGRKPPGPVWTDEDRARARARAKEMGLGTYLRS